MNIFNKIAEFRKVQLKASKVNMTYKLKDCELEDLAKKLKDTGNINVYSQLARIYLDMFNENKDIGILRFWLNSQSVRIFGVDIILDKPLYNKTFNY